MSGALYNSEPVSDGDHGPGGDETDAVNSSRGSSVITRASATDNSTEHLEMALLRPVARSKTV